MSAALPRDLCDALIIQIYDSHKVCYFVVINHSVTCPQSYQCLALFACCTEIGTIFNIVFVCSIAKPSTALWTRAHLHRLVCLPTTTLFWASTTPGMISHCERLVHHTPNIHMLTHLAVQSLSTCFYAGSRLERIAHTHSFGNCNITVAAMHTHV